MLVRLIHPKHGEHIAYSPLEVERCMQNGWTLKPEAVPVLEQPKKKRGRPAKAK